MTQKGSIGRKFIQADFNYILNTARTAKDQAAVLRKKKEELSEAIDTLDNFELTCLETLKKLSGKDLYVFAMDHNYGRAE